MWSAQTYIVPTHGLFKRHLSGKEVTRQSLLHTQVTGRHGSQLERGVKVKPSFGACPYQTVCKSQAKLHRPGLRTAAPLQSLPTLLFGAALLPWLPWLASSVLSGPRSAGASPLLPRLPPGSAPQDPRTGPSPILEPPLWWLSSC